MNKRKLEQFIKRAGVAQDRQVNSAPVVGYREWLYLQYPKAALKVYLRLSQRLLDEQLRQTFEIANIDAEPTGTGAFSHFLETVEQLCVAYRLTVYVETVQTDRLVHFLERQGYLKHLYPGQTWLRSMYKTMPPFTMNVSKEWLLEKAKAEDGCIVSVGGLITELK